MAREQLGEAALWGVAEHLLAGILDAENGGNWQRAGRKGLPRPKPVARPGVKGDDSETFRGEVVPLDEMKRRFAERKAQWMAETEDVS